MASAALCLAVSTAQAQTFRGNQACKAKFPAYASWMETRWTTCERAPTRDPAAMNAWQCWCRRG